MVKRQRPQSGAAKQSKAVRFPKGFWTKKFWGRGYGVPKNRVKRPVEKRVIG